MDTNWITTTQGAELTGYSAGHLRMLARKKIILAVMVGRDWMLNRAALVAHWQTMTRLGALKHNPNRKTKQGGDYERG